MAIVQISRITNRKGLAVDLPEPLAGAELGWVLDERRLFIGNGELSEGAPAVGNTEILTEYSDIFDLASAYTYKGLAAGYEVQTGPYPGTPITQSLQSRLDSYAIVTDFGAVGDGTTDDTAAINRALYQLYCVQNNPQSRRSLYFPAGEYLVTGTILIPAFATLYGDGNNASIIKFYVAPWTDSAAWQAGVLVSYQGEYYRSNFPVPPGTSIADTIYWTQEPAPTYAARTADSMQQTGNNIGTNGAVQPQNIEVINLKITTNLLHDALLIEDTKNSNFVNVSINGPLTDLDIADFAANTIKDADQLVAGYQYIIDFVGSTDFTTVGASSNTVGLLFTATGPTTGTGTAAIQKPNVSAVAWASTESYPCSNVKLDNCGGSGFTYFTNTQEQIQGIVVSNSELDTFYQGFYIGGDAPVNGGPTGFRIIQNIFDNIYGEGIVFENVGMNVSGYNSFYDVGNEFAGVDYPFTPIIDIRTSDNVSIGDMFQRTLAIAESSGNPRIALNNTVSIGIDGADAIQLGSYTRYTGNTQTLDDASAGALFTINATTRAFAMNYTIVRGSTTRTGVFTVVASTDGAGGDLVYDDAGFENSTTGVSLSASESGSVVQVDWDTNPGTGSDATIYYSITKLA